MSVHRIRGGSLAEIELPQAIIETFARFLVPEIRKYYDSEQDQREFLENFWQLEANKDRDHLLIVPAFLYLVYLTGSIGKVKEHDYQAVQDEVCAVVSAAKSYPNINFIVP